MSTSMFIFSLLSMIAMPILLIILIVQAIRRKPIKKIAIGLCGSFVVFIICVMMTPTPNIETKTGEQTQIDTQSSEPSQKSQEEINEQMRENAIEADFIKINGNEWKDKDVFATGKVSFVEVSEPAINFTLTTTEGDGFGVYSIFTFSTLVGEVLDGSTVKIYGIVGDRNKLGMPSITATIIETIAEEQTSSKPSEDAAVPPVESIPSSTPNVATPPTIPDKSVAPSETMGEKNALKNAKTYLSMIPFSYTGLIAQLEFEGYSNAESIYGADNCGANWNEQATKKAKTYLDMMAFSRDGLIAQLEFEGFTNEQAIYGTEANGY